MRRHRLRIALLTLGVVFGYGSGIAHLLHHHHHHHGHHGGFHDRPCW